MNVTLAFPQETLTSSFHQTSGASRVLLTLKDLLKVTSGGSHLSSSPRTLSLLTHMEGCRFRLNCAEERSLNLYCRVPMDPDSWCVKDLNGLSHHVKLAMTFSLEQIGVRQKNYKCIIVVKMSCSIIFIIPSNILSSA